MPLEPILVAEPESLPPLPTLGAAHQEPIRSRENRVVEIDPEAIAGEDLEKQEIDLTETDDSRAIDGGEFEVSSDISLPIEIQDQISLSEQLDRLKRLFDSGDLTKEEYHRAKAKLLA